MGVLWDTTYDRGLGINTEEKLLSRLKNLLEAFTADLDDTQFADLCEAIAETYDAISYRNFSDKDAALDALRKAYDYQKLAVDRIRNNPELRPRLISSLNNLALLLTELGRFSSAIEAINEAMNLCREIEPSPSFLTAQSLVNLGNIYYYQGKFKKAIEIYCEALEIYEGMNPFTRHSLNKLGYCLHNVASALGELELKKTKLDVIKFIRDYDDAVRDKEDFEIVLDLKGLIKRIKYAVRKRADVVYTEP